MSHLGSELDGWRVEEYGRSREGVPLRVFLPEQDGPVAGLLTAAQHGEEADTALLVRRLLERVPGHRDALGGDPRSQPGRPARRDEAERGRRRPQPKLPGLDLGAGRDLHLSAGDRPELRVLANRTNRSSPGAHAGSEPETQALTALIERLEPPLVVDLHSPLELIFVRGDVPSELTAALARSAGIPAQDEFEGHCPGAFDDWLTERGTPVLVYEIEHSGLPALCKRHLPGLEALLRG